MALPTQSKVKGFRGSPICTLIHRSSWAARLRCGACDLRHHARAVATGKPLLYRCHLGFYEMAIPILIHGSHVATLTSGQILQEQQSASAFAQLMHRLQPLGIPEPRLRAAYQKAPWLPRERLMHVMHLLADTDQSITVICFACGFNSLTHFNSIFRQSEGCSPSQFREQHRQD